MHKLSHTKLINLNVCVICGNASNRPDVAVWKEVINVKNHTVHPVYLNVDVLKSFINFKNWNDNDSKML